MNMNEASNERHNSIVIAKACKSKAGKIPEFVERSFEEKEEYRYPVRNEGDVAEIKRIGPKLISVHLYNSEEKNHATEEIYFGIISKTKDIGDSKGGIYLFYRMKCKIDNPLKIKDIESVLDLDLGEDFDDSSFVNVEEAPGLASEIRMMINPAHKPPKADLEKRQYHQLSSENNLSWVSQRNEHCIRHFEEGDSGSDNGNCSEFQRDYERIVHLKAFRRLVDKAQIFTASRGDHYRTRMTHTLEVAQIARAIATALGLNVHLSESIALAHDLGHTPFGHQGERTLDDIMKEKGNLCIGLGDDRNPFGGFKHNLQALRVASHLEEKNLDFAGTNLSYQVLEGVLKHTDFQIKNCEECFYKNKGKCDQSCFDARDFFPEGDLKHLHLKVEHPTTLEGQVVLIADEIAQRSHDLDDALSDRLINVEDLISLLSLKKVKSIGDKLRQIDLDIKNSVDKNRQFVEIGKISRGLAVSTIIDYFVEDVVDRSLKNIAKFDKSDKSYCSESHRFKNRLITFSKDGNSVCEYLEKIVKKKVINSTDVVKFDNRAKKIISDLFDAYYHNPRLLPHGVLRRMYLESGRKCEYAICFATGCPKVVKKEIENIVFGAGSKDDKELSKDFKTKRKILVRTVADFISGMTDSYAIKEHRAIAE